jgi:polyphosphate kinase
VAAELTSETPDTAASEPLPVDRFSDRELSWLAFNQRVLELAEDETVPPLERAKFLAIFASNLDEFYMVRVAGLKRRMASGIAVRAASGLTPRDLMKQVHDRTRALQAEHAQALRDLVPTLADAGIEIVRWRDLDDDEQKSLSQLFDEQVFAVLTPLAVDPAHPFPYISGLSLNLAVVVRNPTTGQEHFARVKVPPTFPRFVPTDSGERFVPLEDVIAAHLDRLFPGMEILQRHTFRVTRNEDVEVEEDESENLLKALERELSRRRFGPPVRLEVEETIDPHVLDLLVEELDIHRNEVISVPWPLDLTGLFAISNLDHPELLYPPFVPMTSAELSEVETSDAPEILEVMRSRDVLLHHPYDSFSTSVQAFLEEAAEDPNVLAIKQTLYRTSGDSPIVHALIQAAEAGKQVLVLVEIKARFDEQANIQWARKLEQAGCHVVYGVVGLKTHSKLSMVVRQDEDGVLRRYTHIGTGNYHPKTARLYEDLGLLTSSAAVGDDVSKLFNVLTGYSLTTDYQRLLVAPHSVRDGLVERIEREVDHHLAGRPARIRFKVNSIVDERIIDALYRASQAGVPVDVLVRGICSIKAGVPGLSENIRVRSILGRFLEHSRIYWFENDGEPDVWIGSAYLMHRYLDRRVEALVSIVAEHHVASLGRLLDLSFDPGTMSWHLLPNGEWQKVSTDAEGRPLNDLQAELIALKRQSRRVPLR